MIIRRFASHYALMPDGTFGKWPVIEITNDGQIVSLSVSPEGFKEQPSLEFRGGILVPGFVDAQTTATTQKHTLEVKDLNRHMASGTLILGADAETFSKFGKRTYPPFLTDNKINSTLNDSVIVSSANGITLLDKLKTATIKNPEITLDKTLFYATANGADLLGVANLFGRFVPGLFSGLMVLEQLDLQNLKLMPQTRVKWLNQPKNPML
jgi:N-acetylglucosamine-6-phosphate deacetylase